MKAILKLILFALILGPGASFVLAGTIVNQPTYTTDQHWTLAGSPYTVQQNLTVASATNPILTIDAGVVVNFNSGVFLQIGSGTTGRLAVNGTAAQPVVLQGTAAAIWQGIHIYNSPTTSSQLSFFSIQNVNASAIFVSIGAVNSPIIHHGTITTYAGSFGINFDESAGTPVVYACSFSGAGTAITGRTIDHPWSGCCNWYGNSSGPSGAGPGTGTAVGTAVSYEPWLLAAPSTTNYFTNVNVLDRTFNPTIGIKAKIFFTAFASVGWTLKIFNPGGSLIQTFTGTGVSGNVNWDGKVGGVIQTPGTYSYEISGASITTVHGRLVLSNTLQFTISTPSVSEPFFSPNGDGIKDTTTVTATISYNGANWTVNVKNSGGTTVRTASGSGASVSYTWDGKNQAIPPVVQPDGPYTFEILATDDLASAHVTSSPAVLDNTPPTSVITSPTASQVLSNLYQSGSADVPVIGTANDTNLNDWILDFKRTGVSYSNIANATTPKIATTIAVWNTEALPDFYSPTNFYSLRLTTTDKAGNVTTLVLEPLNLENFTMSQTPLYFNGATGGTTTINTIFPIAGTHQTLVVKNKAGQVVRTLLSDVTNPATAQMWNGRVDSSPTSALFPDGPYFYVSTFTNGTYSMTWDKTAEQYDNTDTGNVPLDSVTTFDPFNNSPMIMTYTVPANTTCRVFVIVGTSANNDNFANEAKCTMADFNCLVHDYVAPGTYTAYWGGVDSTGVYRQDFNRYTFRCVKKSDPSYPLLVNFSRNAVVLYGTKPVIGSITVNPAFYGPKDVFGPTGSPNQVASFTLSTYQSQPVNITTTFMNQSTLSVVRTIAQSNVSPGNVTVTWDGFADNGFRVAPGRYTVTILVSDSMGNTVKSQVMTTILY